MKKYYVLGIILLLTGCAKPAVKDFCLQSTCNSLENSGTHYQAVQQGYFMGPQ